MAADDLPVGFTVDQGQDGGGLPPGFTVDAPTKRQPTVLERATEMANAALAMSPMGALAGRGKKALEGLDKAAYSAGGAVTDVTGSPAAGTAANVAVQAIPAAVGGVVGTIAKAPLRTGAETLVQQALKPSIKALKNEGTTGVNSERAIGTMLDEGVNVSMGGVEKLQGKIDALSASITDAIKGSGATVDTHAVAARLQDVIKGIEATSLHPQDRIAAVEKIYTDVLQNPSLQRNISVERANEIKKGIYATLKNEYGKLSTDAVTADKALARGLKEDVAAAVPGVAEMSKKESELLNALELAKHRALVTGNKDMGGIGWLIENPLRFAAFMADRSPMFKSAIARLVNQTSENAPLLGAAAGAALPQKKE